MIMNVKSLLIRKKTSKAILNENNLKKRKPEDSVNKSIYDLNEEEDDDEYFYRNLNKTDLVDNYTDITSYHVDDDTLFEVIPTQLNAALSSQKILNIGTSIDEDSNVSYRSYSSFSRTIVDNTAIVIDDDLEKDYEYLDNPDLCFQEPALYIRSETPPLFTPNEAILNSNVGGSCFIDVTFEMLWHCVLPWVVDEIFDSKKINESTNTFDKVLLRSYKLHCSGTLEGRIAASSEIENFVWSLSTYQRGKWDDCNKLFNFFLDNLSPSVLSLPFFDLNNVLLKSSIIFMLLHAYHTLLLPVILINLFIEML
ncbi:MAG: hypothetical protein EXX96DRAFT_319621 [Benjaminiella poitrasii]|nr:MAG: hypothetical protein EXX96DRAFT_319621 [Benjaminiella poitrasii]